MIFTVSPDPQTPSFDSRKAESDSFPKRGGVDMRDPVLVTDAAVREIQSLAGDVPIGVRCVVGSEPERAQKRDKAQKGANE